MAKVDQFTEGKRGNMLPGYPAPNCKGCEHFFEMTDESGCRQPVASTMQRIASGECAYWVPVVQHGKQKTEK